MGGGRAAMAKLENRIRELEIELGSVQSKTSDTYKGFQKAERRIKELQFQQDEEIAALNLAKFRKAQQDLEETEERSKMAGASLQFCKSTLPQSISHEELQLGDLEI